MEFLNFELFQFLSFPSFISIYHNCYGMTYTLELIPLASSLVNSRELFSQLSQAFYVLSKSHSHWTTDESWFDFQTGHCGKTGSRAHLASYSTGNGDLPPGVKLKTHLRLTSRLRMIGAAPPHPHMPSWFVQEQLYLHLCRYETKHKSKHFVKSLDSQTIIRQKSSHRITLHAEIY